MSGDRDDVTENLGSRDTTLLNRGALPLLSPSLHSLYRMALLIRATFNNTNLPGRTAEEELVAFGSQASRQASNHCTRAIVSPLTFSSPAFTRGMRFATYIFVGQSKAFPRVSPGWKGAGSSQDKPERKTRTARRRDKNKNENKQ